LGVVVPVVISTVCELIVRVCFGSCRVAEEVVKAVMESTEEMELTSQEAAMMADAAVSAAHLCKALLSSHPLRVVGS
jgi:hypothetical protein